MNSKKFKKRKYVGCCIKTDYGKPFKLKTLENLQCKHNIVQQ